MKTITPDQFKSQLRRQGKSLVEYCREKDLDYYTTASVLNGSRKAIRGNGFKAAVKLGLKEAA